jgi:hypothetical protein
MTIRAIATTLSLNPKFTCVSTARESLPARPDMRGFALDPMLPLHSGPRSFHLKDGAR